MDRIIIGSTAIQHHFPDFPRQPKDLDYAVKDDKLYSSNREVEFLLNPIIFKYCSEKIPSKDLLYTLKVSHLFWDINWDKHMFDVQFLRNKGCVLQMDFFNEMLEYWKQTKEEVRRSDLNMSKEDFFTNAINYDENDELHLILNPVPMYTRLLADGAEVELDESKFHPLTHEEKCAVVFEETAVMAYERYKDENYNVAFVKMLKKCIISHFPIYIALFAIDNYIELHKPKFNYIKFISDGISSKRIK